MRYRNKCLILLLFTCIFLLSAISNLNSNSINFHYNVINDGPSPKNSANGITITTPENITYVEPMNGYYHGTYGFENEQHYTAGLNLEFLDEYYGHGAGVYCDILSIDGPFNGHNKILNMKDSQGSTNTWGVHHIDNPQSLGTIEFFLTSNQPASGSAIKRHYIQFRALDNTIAFQMMIQLHDSTLRYYDGSSWQNIITTTPDVWYHHSISFNCENGTNGQFTWIVSNEQGSELARIENIEFENDLDAIEEIYIGTTVSDYSGTTIWDAFGFSWDPNYEIGNNRNETLLLGYETEYDLEWQGYSLDGQENVTIFGNHTIPVPLNGTHTIQVFGTDSIGTIYQSNLRYFTYGTTSVPQITIHSPDFDDFYGSIAPTYWVTINGEYDAVWYTLDNGVTNITASGLNEIIDQTEWDKVADGIVYLRFYFNNSLGNLAYSDVNFTKDTVAPIITINSPIEYEKFGKISPTYNLSIAEPYLDTMWYTIDGGVTNISADLPLILPLTGTIDQIEWDKLANGTVSIDFYADDESMNVGFAQVIIEKEVTPPIISIISPNEDDLFYTIAPAFEIIIQEFDLNTTWYTLDDGITNYIFTGLTGSIDQTEWDKYGNGTVTIKFYANDTYGYENFTQVTVRKDISPPTIIINSPSPGAAFSAVAPAYNITVIDFQLDSMWYTIDGGITNFSMSSSTGTIDQTEWDKKSEENVIIRFYANDTLGNTEYSEVTIAKDSITPVISINSPNPIELFGVLSPSYNLSIIEPNLDSIWYTLDGGATNITTSSLSGTIDQTEWNKLGNGTVTIRFYARDLVGHIGFSQVVVLKDIIAPIITINSPNTADIFGAGAPSFSISITESNLDLVWYTLNGGTTNITILSLSGTIDQMEWDKLGNGTITLEFYAIDIAGNVGISQIIIYKDKAAPIIIINSPEQNEEFSSVAPNFNITVIDSRLDSMWYTIDNGSTIILLFSKAGTIDQTEWDKMGEGSVYLKFYANDTLGNTGFSEVVIIKDFFAGIDPIELITPISYSDIFSNVLEFSWYSLDAGFGSVNFTLQVSNSSDFIHINFQSVNIAETPVVTNFSAPLSLTQGQYFWRVRFTYGIYNGDWSEYFSFILFINNYAPYLILNEYTPTNGTRLTIFKFTATYYDDDNNKPSFIRLILNGTPYIMEKLNPFDIDYTDGCLYQFLVCLNPSEYAYTFSFECSDGGFYESTTIFLGPLVELEEPPDGEQGLIDLNSTNAMIMGISVVTGLGIVIPIVALTEIKVKKNKTKQKQPSKIKK